MRLFAALLTALLLALSLFAAPLCAQGGKKPGRTVSAAQYRALLEKSRDQLQKLERRAPRNLTPVLKNLRQDLIVKRADGVTQSAPGTQWEAWGLGFERSDLIPQNATRAQTRELRGIIEARLSEFDAWATPNSDGTYFEAADAATIVRQLENSGQIRTGPTWLQKAVDDVKAWFARMWDNFIKWVESLFPTRTAPVQTPDASWLWPVFWAIVVALLGVLVFLLARAFAGTGRWRWRRGKVGPDAPLSPEDAELLLLPPDELRIRALRFADEANFREALRHRFIAILLDFDGRSVWRYDVRRTNWEHIEALRRNAQKSGDNARGNLAAPLGDLTRRFDRVRYGGADCSQSDWLAFERDANALEAQAGSAPSARPEFAEASQ